jgi:YVTN family beta-propeller protein
VVDTATNTVVGNIAVGATPEGVSVTPDGAFVYVANSFSESVSVIDAATNTVIATIATGAGSAPFAFGNFIGGAGSGPPPPPPPTASLPIPALSPWALLLLAAIVAIGGAYAVGRRAS